MRFSTEAKNARGKSNKLVSTLRGYAFSNHWLREEGETQGSSVLFGTKRRCRDQRARKGSHGCGGNGSQAGRRGRGRHRTSPYFDQQGFHTSGTGDSDGRCSQALRERRYGSGSGLTSGGLQIDAPVRGRPP